MPSIQNTIIEFNFTLLSGRIYKNKACLLYTSDAADEL